MSLLPHVAELNLHGKYSYKMLFTLKFNHYLIVKVLTVGDPGGLDGHGVGDIFGDAVPVLGERAQGPVPQPDARIVTPGAYGRAFSRGETEYGGLGLRGV